MIRNVYLLLSLVLFLLSCSNKKVFNTKERLYKLKVEFSSPDRVENNRLVKFESVFNIIGIDSFLIYELPNKITTEQDNIILSDTILYDIFIHKRNEFFGQLIKYKDSTKAIKLKTDSILELRAMRGGWNEDLLKGINIIKVDTFFVNDTLQYKFLFNNSFFDSAKLEFIKPKKDFDFSLSRPLDSLYKGKLILAKFYIKTDQKGEYDFSNTYKITLLDSFNTQRYKKVIEKFYFK